MSAPLEFPGSDQSTIGVELELQLLDAATLDLQDGIVSLMDLYPGSRYIKPELIQSSVELNTPVCRSIDQLQTELLSLIRQLKIGCRKFGMTLCGAGTHPFGRRLALITPLPRYQQLEKSGGYLAHTQVTYATHVHIGMPSADMAIQVLNRVNPLLPALLALSANSPFWRGYPTGYASYRHRIVAGARSYGRPPYFDGWKDFEQFYRAAETAAMLKSIKDMHWDIRPQPELGTLELRVMDAQSTVAETTAIAALVQALFCYLIWTPERELDQRLPERLPWWLEKENHFRASRLGLEAKYIFDQQGGTRPIRELVEDMLELVQPVAAELGTQEHVRRLADSIASGSGYTAQRRIFEETESTKQVARWLVERLDTEVEELEL